MALSSYRKHKVYLAAAIGFGLGSDDPEEIAYFNKVIAEFNKQKKNKHMGIPRED